MIVKSGRNEFEINKEDYFLDNGKCIQLITRKIGSGWDWSYPVISKANWKKYLPHLEHVIEANNSSSGKGSDVKYYKLKEVGK